MEAVKLQSSVDSLERSKNNAITGIIFFEFGDYQFPDAHWNDFVVVILHWWVSALKDLSLGNSDKTEMRFMDGPFYVKLYKKNKDLISIECFSDGATERLYFLERYPLDELCDAVFDIARITLGACVKKGWESEEILQLRSLLQDIDNHKG